MFQLIVYTVVVYSFKVDYQYGFSGVLVGL